MRKFTIFSFIILFAITSCNNEDEISNSALLNNQDDSTSEIILQERDPNLPKVWSKKIAPRPGTSHRNHRKIKEHIFFIINHLYISYFLYFCHILPIFRYSVHF